MHHYFLKQIKSNMAPFTFAQKPNGRFSRGKKAHGSTLTPMAAAYGRMYTAFVSSKLRLTFGGSHQWGGDFRTRRWLVNNLFLIVSVLDTSAEIATTFDLIPLVESDQIKKLPERKMRTVWCELIFWWYFDVWIWTMRNILRLEYLFHADTWFFNVLKLDTSGKGYQILRYQIRKRPSWKRLLSI